MIDNIFDLTKEWYPEEVPLQEIGRITLNQNVYVPACPSFVSSNLEP